MKILWVSPFLLHPTKSGSQIRSLGMLRELHRRNQVDFAALVLDGQAAEGLPRAGEYSARAFTVPHSVPHRSSPRFLPQLVGSFFSPRPLSIDRYVSPPLRALVAARLAAETYDVLVADFLVSAANVPDLGAAVLFQHNVEAVIWRRLAEHGSTAIHRRYFAGQARRMAEYERACCRSARRVVAVSPVDAAYFTNEYGVERSASVATGVDVDYFAPPAQAEPAADLVFTGGMDWLPNMEGVLWFAAEILPLIRARRPATTLAIVGRNPQPSILRLGERDPLTRVTGTVPDIRPYLWGGKVSIVPLRAGSGTRLKIYEAMAAGAPVVSTTVGAEGLTYTPGVDLERADTPGEFAARCVELLEDEDRRRRMAETARRLVVERFSWAAVTREFEEILRGASLPIRG